MIRHVARAAAALVALVAVLFIVVPAVTRLAFLLDPPASGNPTDMAFALHRPTGFLHVVPGLVMVALMPIQASRRLRQRWPAIHRWSGRLFVLVGILLCGSAVVMNIRFPLVGGLLKLTVIYAMCVAQLATMALGMRAIWRRDVPGHRKWMARAMGVAFSGGSAGFFVVPFYLMGEVTDLVVGVGRWLGFLGTLAAVEWWLRSGRPIQPPREAPAVGQAPSDRDAFEPATRPPFLQSQE